MLECFITAKLSRSSAPRAALQLQEPISSGGFREAWSHCTHAHAWSMEVPSPCASCKICCQGQITQRRMPDLGQKDSNAIRYEDQEVRRSNTELTDEGPQGRSRGILSTECRFGILLGGGGVIGVG
jgi:hypothetical protein